MVLRDSKRIRRRRPRQQCSKCHWILRDRSKLAGHNRRCDNRHFVHARPCEKCNSFHDNQQLEGGRACGLRNETQKCVAVYDTLNGEGSGCRDDGASYDLGAEEMNIHQERSVLPPFRKVPGLEGAIYHENEKTIVDGANSLSGKFCNLQLPLGMQLPSIHELNMNPFELEFMLFINENYLSPVVYDSVMKWAKRASSHGYRFDSPCHRTLKKKLSSLISDEKHGGRLHCKVFEAQEIGADKPVHLWYFDPLEVFASALRDPAIMESFIPYPQKKLTTCGQRIYDDFTSADWFHTAFLRSPATDDHGVLRDNCLFVAIGNFDDASCIDRLQKNSEHPFLQTFLNLSMKARSKADAWNLMALLPDLEISDHEKRNATTGDGGDLAMRRLHLYHKCTDFLHSKFKDSTTPHRLFVHGRGWTDVYFEVAMIIGDTEQHNKICGFRGGNGLYRIHACRDCTVTTYEADDPRVSCQRRKVKEVKEFLDRVVDGMKEHRDKLPPIPANWPFRGKNKTTSTGAEYCRVISHNPIVPSLMQHNFGGHEEGVLGATPFEVLHQFHAGNIKYVLTSLYNYKTIPDHFLEWIKCRHAAVHVYGSVETESSGAESAGPDSEYDSDVSESDNNDVHYDNLCRNNKTTDMKLTEYEIYRLWIKNRPSSRGRTTQRDVFSKVHFERAARFINQQLQRQSDRSIPRLSYRAGLTAISKMQSQDFPGLCLLTILSMGGMTTIGNNGKESMNLEKDFTLLLWLCISLNDNLNQERYTDRCLQILKERIVRFMTVMRSVIGNQREFQSSLGLRIAKFHATLHYPDQIKKFGSPQNFFGGYLESFLKNYLKNPSKRISGRKDRLQHDILLREKERRKLTLAKRIFLQSPNVPTKFDLPSNVNTDEANTDEEYDNQMPASDCDDSIELGFIPLTESDEKSITETAGRRYRLPLVPEFTVKKDMNTEQIWVLSKIRDNSTPQQHKRNDGTPFYALFHPHDAGDAASVKNIVNSAIQRASACMENREVTRIDFFYHVTVPSLLDGEANVQLRCHPKWTILTDEGVAQAVVWKDWLEVNWEDDRGSMYTVPARLQLWGNVHYSNGETALLASVRSLQSKTHLGQHDRMFFARVDEMQGGNESYNVVDFDSIVSTAFVVPAITEVGKYNSPQQAFQHLQQSNCYVSLPSRSDWKDIGWKHKMTSEK